MHLAGTVSVSGAIPADQHQLDVKSSAASVASPTYLDNAVAESGFPTLQMRVLAHGIINISIVEDLGARGEGASLDYPDLHRVSLHFIDAPARSRIIAVTMQDQADIAEIMLYR